MAGAACRSASPDMSVNPMAPPNWRSPWWTEHRGRGVGATLLDHLFADDARRAGVRELHGDLLTDNDAVRRLLARALPAPRFTPDGATVHVSSQLEPGLLTLEDLLADLEPRLLATH